jgi:hypothetical protein
MGVASMGLASVCRKVQRIASRHTIEIELILKALAVSCANVSHRKLATVLNDVCAFRKRPVAKPALN